MTAPRFSASRGRKSTGFAETSLVSAWRQFRQARTLGSLEELLTSPEGFGLTEATPLQRQIARLVDGDPRLDPSDPQLIEAAGDCTALRGVRPSEVTIVAAIRSAKTLLSVAQAVRATQIVDVTGLKPGEVPRVSIVSLKLDLAASALQHLRGAVNHSPVLSNLLCGEPTGDSITLRHPSGTPIEIKVVAGSRAGSTLVSRWCAGLILDEAPRMQGSDEAVVNYDEARGAVRGRLRPGAQILSIGSPWAPYGPIYRQVTEHWKKPAPNRVVIRAPGWAMNPNWWTPERCAQLQAEEPDMYRVDCLAEFAAPEEALFNPDALKSAMREGPLELPPDNRRTYVAGMDAGTRSNAWTLVIMTREGANKKVALAREWKGSRNEPLTPSVVLEEIAQICRVYRVDTVWCDEWSADALVDLAHKLSGLHLYPIMTRSKEKVDRAQEIRMAMLEGNLELPPVDALREDLLRVRKVPTSSGVTLKLPQTSDGRHCDFVPSLMLAWAQHVPEAAADRPKHATEAWFAAEQERMLLEAERRQPNMQPRRYRR